MRRPLLAVLAGVVIVGAALKGSGLLDRRDRPVAVVGGTMGGGKMVGGVVPAPLASPLPPASDGKVEVYAAARGPGVALAVASVPTRVYVPNSSARTVSVVDPATMQVVGTLPVGRVPHHVTPSWDMSRLYVNNTESNTLTVIDPRTATVSATIDVVDPYNLYFTPDGTKAIVVAERHRRLDFYDPASWKPLGSVAVPWPGVDHGDFSADGRWFVASTEFSGEVVRVDTQTMTLAGHAHVDGLPVDVKVSPDGSAFYVTNQGRHGVSILDSDTLAEVGFLPTGAGAHGLCLSRDARSMYVSNRLAGTVSVIDLDRRAVSATWVVGGSPDMLQVSADGTRLWASNRFQGSVSVVDTSSGAVVSTIPTGPGAHGLTLFPQPGRYSVGHNGVYR